MAPVGSYSGPWIYRFLFAVVFFCCCCCPTCRGVWWQATSRGACGGELTFEEPRKMLLAASGGAHCADGSEYPVLAAALAAALSLRTTSRGVHPLSHPRRIEAPQPHPAETAGRLTPCQLVHIEREPKKMCNNRPRGSCAGTPGHRGHGALEEHHIEATNERVADWTGRELAWRRNLRAGPARAELEPNATRRNAGCRERRLRHLLTVESCRLPPRTSPELVQLCMYCGRMQRLLGRCEIRTNTIQQCRV